MTGAERIFIKLTRELGVAVRLAGRDPGRNARLRLALIRARALGMPQAAIDLAIEPADRNELTPEWQSVGYEGYGPGGAAVLADCLTLDSGATALAVRRTFSAHGGQLGASGAVSYLFNEVGALGFSPGVPVGALTRAAFAAGAEDVVRRADGSLEVLTAPLEFESVRDRLARSGYRTEKGAITRRSATAIAVEGEAAVSMARLLESLAELDEVQNVYTNATLPDAILARLPA